MSQLFKNQQVIFMEKYYKFFDAVAQARRGHIIKSEKIVPLVWNKDIKSLVLKHDKEHLYDPCITEDLLDKEEWTVEKEQHGFSWVIEQLKTGRKVRRANWGNDCFIYCDSGFIYDEDCDPYGIDLRDMMAENWEEGD